MLQNLFKLISGETSAFVKEVSFTAVACVASVVEEGFGANYYDVFMPLAKQVLSAPAPAVPAGGLGSKAAKSAAVQAVKAATKLRARAIECIGIIGSAVGKARFAADAKEVMDVLLAAQAAGLPPDDPQTQSIVNSCARICNCLGADFLPYMPLVLPPLLEAARVKDDDITVSDVDAGDAAAQAAAGGGGGGGGGGDDDDSESNDDGFERLTVEIRGVGLRQFCINTAALQEKATACQLLYQYITDLGLSFLPYIEQTAAVLLPLMRFEYMEDVRRASMLAMPRLLKILTAALRERKAGGGAGGGGAPPSAEALATVTAADMAPAQALFEQIVEKLLECLTAERDKETHATAGDALATCFKVSKEHCDLAPNGPMGASSESVVKIVEILRDVMVSIVEERQRVLAEAQEDEDFDEEAFNQLAGDLEWEDELLTSIIDANGWLLKLHKENFLPVLQKLLLEPIAAMLGHGLHQFRCAAVCVVDDIIEFIGEAGWPLLPQLLPALVEACQDEESEGVRQAAAYGIGIAARSAGPSFGPFVLPALQALGAMVTMDGAREEDNARSTDNAVQAIGLICKHRADTPGIDVNVVWPQVRSCLPLLLCLFVCVVVARKGLVCVCVCVCVCARACV